MLGGPVNVLGYARFCTGHHWNPRFDRRSRFSQPRENTLWYYRSVADKFRKRLPGQLANELHEIVEVLENGSMTR
jgi:hypothetical protein